MNREKFLQLILPGFLVLFVYWFVAPRLLGKWGDHVNPRASAQRARDQLNQQRQSAPSAEQLHREAAAVADAESATEEARAKNAAAEERAADAEKRAVELERQWADLTAPKTAPAKRTRLLGRVEAVLTAHNLTPIEQGPAESSQVPAGLRPALDPAGTAGGDGGRVYKFRFRGRYGEVTAALEELAGKKWEVFPLGLTMEEADLGQPVRTWTLLVWV